MREVRHPVHDRESCDECRLRALALSLAAGRGTARDAWEVQGWLLATGQPGLDPRVLDSFSRL